MIKSPLNYTGNKFKLLNQIIPVFPKVSKFADVFCGGLNVGINADADVVFANDRNKSIIEIYEYFKNNNIDEILNEIKRIINFYNLSKTNHDGFLKLRNDYNDNKNPLKLYVLSCYSFNNIIRFNDKSYFNTSFGKNKSSFNNKIEENLLKFVNILKNKNVIFSSKDFKDFDYESADLIYCDPPYLISEAVYNERGGGLNKMMQTYCRFLMRCIKTAKCLLCRMSLNIKDLLMKNFVNGLKSTIPLF